MTEVEMAEDNEATEEEAVLPDGDVPKVRIVPSKKEADDTEEETAPLTNIPRSGGFVEPKEHEHWSARYKRSAKILIPWNHAPKDGKELPLDNSGCCNYFCVGWVTSIMIRALRHGLGMKDIFTLSTLDQSKEAAGRLQRLWTEEQEKAEKAKREPSFARVCMQFCITRIWISTLFFTVSIILQFIAPSLLLKAILDYISDPDADVSKGLWLLGLLSLALFIKLAGFTLNFNVGLQSAIRLTGAIQYLGYSKLLRLSNPNDNYLGKLVTICTSDQERLAEAVITTVLFTGTPVMFLLSTIYSWYLIGPMCLLGLLIVLLLYPIMGGIATLTARLRREVVKCTDKRVSLMNEIINSIRLIKMYAWELPFADKIKKLRKKEMQELRKTGFLQSVSFSVTPCITVVAAIVTIIALTNTDLVLTGSIAFTVFSIFTALQFSVATLPIALRSLAEAKVCAERMKQFLILPEYSHPKVGAAGEEDQFSVSLKDYNCAWEESQDSKTKKDKDKKENQEKRKISFFSKKSEKAAEKGDDGANGDVKEELLQKPDEPAKSVQALFNIDFQVKHGELIGIAGAVGSGKTSLVSSIMGEMKHMSGQNSIYGRLALVPQQAWIYGGTVRENILFGSSYDEKMFDKTVEAAALKPDLEGWPSGDQTEVGERGLTLSGGQKQRISLARALYSVLVDAEAENAKYIVLMDDPLSAVDPAVAKHIFDKAIVDLLKDHTVLLVTHGVQFLSRCDRVAFMKNGAIVEFDTYENLIKSGKDLVNMISYDQSQKVEKKLDDSGAASNIDPKKRLRERTISVSSENEQGEQNVMKEESDDYAAGWPVLLKYFRACGGYLVIFGIFFLVLVFVFIRLFSSVWLQIWIDAGDGLVDERLANATMNNVTLSDEELRGDIGDNPRLWMYQLVVGMSLVALVVVGLCKGFAMAIALLYGSSKLHDKMLRRIIGSPMSFFDTTPAGRVINRFSKDMDEMDVRMPYYTEFVVQSILLCLSQIGVVCLIYPMFAIIALAIIGVFIFFDVGMNKGILETRKLENKTKSLVLNDITSVVPGIPVIRGSERQAVFQQKFDADLNRNLSAQMLFRYSNRWYGFRMDFLGTLTILITAAVCIFNKDTVTPAEAGLALANIFQVATFIPFVMRMKADYRARFNSVERVCEYAYELEQEAPLSKEDSKVPEGWPQKGQLEMKGVCFRYRESMPLVLKNLTVKIEAGQKVGVVGRTGAGKTTLFGTILRLAELDSGQVIIDDVDVAKIGLADLRSNIAVIPQDPVLFQGTIRYNLDPFDLYDDEELWSAVKRSHLNDKLTEVGEGLNMKVANDGDNLSVGEKQLLCLARALLRKNKILLLDEATASVDVETDYKIQATIKEAFADCTVITIAHRLHTVVNYDKIIVMKKGEIVEFGSPQNLLEQHDGVFRSMMKASVTTT